MNVLPSVEKKYTDRYWGYSCLLLMWAILLCFHTPLNAQNEDYITLKERYLAVEFESGLIMDQPAHSIGFGMGFVRNEYIHFGLSLHFMVNSPRRTLNVGYEEIRKLSLLGLNAQYRKHFTRNMGGLLAFSANIGSSTYNRVRSNSDVFTASGFAAAGKPKIGLFYQLGQRSRVYLSGKYLYSYIFNGPKSFQGVPLLSVGLRFSEIGY